MSPYIFISEGRVVEVRECADGLEAVMYCIENYGEEAVAALTVGGQFHKLEYQHVYRYGHKEEPEVKQ